MAVAGFYRAQPIDFSKKIYFSFYKQVECRWKGEDFRGLWAMEDIKAGEVIWVNRTDDHPDLKEVITDSQTIESWPEEKQEYYLRHVWQLGDDLFASAPSADAVNGDAHNFWNHSCDPNVWISSDDSIVARRDIKKGDEMCFDYSTTDCRYMGFEKCFCGSERCRGYISKDDWMRPELHIRYGNHFMTYMLRKIERLTAQREAANKEKEKDGDLAGLAFHRGDSSVSTSRPDEAVTPSASSTDCSSDDEDGPPSFFDVEDIMFSDIHNIRNCRAVFGVGAMFAFHKTIELRETNTPKGKGLFASVRIPRGTLVWHNHDHFMESAVTMEQIDGMNEVGQRVMKRYCFQVDDDLFVGPTTDGEVTRDARWYMNHSCNPNVWFVGDRKMVACRDIEVDEEICFDYATSETTSERVSECLCGSAKCRRKVRGSDWRSLELQRRYSGHFLSYIQRRLDA